MRAVFGLVLLVGLGLAGFAVFTVQGYFEEQNKRIALAQAASAQITPTVEVYAVTRKIEFGEQLTMADLELIKYAEPHLPEGTFNTELALFPRGEDVPRYVLRQMEPREPVLASKVTAPGVTASITSLLDPGMRAFTIEVDAGSGVGGFLRPGNHVDVYWIGQQSLGLNGSTSVTRLIDQNLQLIAVDQTTDVNTSGASIARTVTLQVTPQQVANLAQAQNSGSLSLSLVGQGGELADAAAEPIVVDECRLFGTGCVVEAAPEPEPEVVEERCRVRVLRGGLSSAEGETPERACN